MLDLQPLAGRWLSTLGGEIPDALALRFKTAMLIEERRLAAVRQLTASILQSAAIAEHQPLLHGGLALGDTVYPGHDLRHTSRVVLLLPASVSLRRIADALLRLEFRRSDVPRVGIRGRIRELAPKRIELRHASGMPLILERGRPLSAPPAWNHRQLTESGADLEVAHGVSCRIPSLPDSFRLLVTAYRFIFDNVPLLSQRSPLWLADLVFLRRTLADMPQVPGELTRQAFDLWSLAGTLDVIGDSSAS